MLLHPVVPPAEQAAIENAPDILPEETEPIPQLVVPTGVPARPRVAAVPAREAESEAKVAEPIIAPEMTDQQLAAAKVATQQSLNVALHNLSLTQGRTLNATQQDLASKIRGFVDSARQAIQNHDWQRARIQAKKAEVLSQEFAPQQ